MAPDGEGCSRMADHARTLRALGKRRARLEREQTQLTPELKAAIRAARADDVPVSEIARLVGMSPQAVRRLYLRD
jgi:DNA-directed RNA polymerase specialized sigma24 family protein